MRSLLHSNIAPQATAANSTIRLPPKQRIRRAFDQAATSYDDAADVQRQICDQLARYFEQAPLELDARSILDAGCGTGYGTYWLTQRWPQARLMLIDFAPAMLAKAYSCLHHSSADVSLVCADIESLPITDHCFDLYWSSLAWQWNDPGSCLEEAGRVLKPDGVLAVATLGTNNFPELRHAFADIDEYSHVLSIASPEQLWETCQANGWTVRIWQRHIVRRYYPDLRTLLHRVKAVGAREVKERRPAPFSRTVWQAVNARYEQLRETEGLPLSYDAIWLIATR